MLKQIHIFVLFSPLINYHFNANFILPSKSKFDYNFQDWIDVNTKNL